MTTNCSPVRKSLNNSDLTTHIDEAPNIWDKLRTSLQVGFSRNRNVLVSGQGPSLGPGDGVHFSHISSRHRPSSRGWFLWWKEAPCLGQGPAEKPGPALHSTFGKQCGKSLPRLTKGGGALFVHACLLRSNIKCFFFVIVTSACFDCQHFRSQITKARL